MARADFARNVRGALLFMAPRVEVDNPYTKPEYVEKILRGTDIWLAQGSVEGYRPEDFADLPSQERSSLESAVHDFVAVAKTVAPKAAASREQVEAAVPSFLHIVRVIQGLLRNEWLDAAAQLVAEADEWAHAAGWPTKRYPKEIAEDFIGTYKVDKLVFAAEGSQLALVPVGRFAPGTDGMFDLAVLPSYDSSMVVREGDRWFIHPLPNEEAKRRDWQREVFVETCLELARLP
jgi:hypothetical protein